MSNKLPESYVRLKHYALLVEDICKDIDLHGFGFDPGVLFSSERYSLDLPEWFLERLYNYVSAQQSVQPTPESSGDFPTVESNSEGSAPAKSG